MDFFNAWKLAGEGQVLKCSETKKWLRKTGWITIDVESVKRVDKTWEVMPPYQSIFWDII